MKISIIGAGNVSNHISPKLVQHGHEILQVFNRKINKAKALAKKVNAEPISDYKKLVTKADMIIIMVSDNAISEVASKIPKRFRNSDCLIVHSSGSISSKELNTFKNFGVFYPLQTFKNLKKSDWGELPILYTANYTHNRKRIKELAKSLEMKSVLKSDKQRKSIHLSAVILNNFINHLFCLNEEWLSKNNSDLELLIPLINKTISNASEGEACKNQTGPARRNDSEVMDSHIKELKKFPELQGLYQAFSESIQKRYK